MPWETRAGRRWGRAEHDYEADGAAAVGSEGASAGREESRMGGAQGAWALRNLKRRVH